MRSSTGNWKLELSLAAILVCGLVQASEFSMFGDENIDWELVNPFDTLEEMLVREMFDTDGNPESDYESARQIINDKLAKVGRGEAVASQRLLNERDAISAIGTLRHRSADACNYVISMNQMQTTDRPIVSKWLRYFGDRKIEECRTELRGLIDGLGDSSRASNVIEKLPADQLLKYIPNLDPITEANWAALVKLMNDVNGSPISIAELNGECKKFFSNYGKFDRVSHILSEMFSVAPEKFSDFEEIPATEAPKQKQILCVELRQRLDAINGRVYN